MKHFIRIQKQNIKKLLKKIVGIEALEQRIAVLEEVTATMDAGLQIENGLRYLDRMRSTSLVENNEKDKNL